MYTRAQKKRGMETKVIGPPGVPRACNVQGTWPWVPNRTETHPNLGSPEFRFLLPG